MSWFPIKFSGGVVRRSDIANNQVTTEAGHPLDARQANPSIEGSMANQFNKQIADAKKSINYNELLNKPQTISNSDTVDNFHASQTAGAKSSCVVTDVNGYINANYINSNTPNDENPPISQFIVTNGNANIKDNYYRKASLAHVKAALGIKNVNFGGFGDIRVFTGIGSGGANGSFDSLEFASTKYSQDFSIYFGNNCIEIPSHINCINAKEISAWDRDADGRLKDGTLNANYLMIDVGGSNTINLGTYSHKDEINKSLVFAQYNEWSILRPYSDNEMYLGHSSQRWKQVFAVNSTVSTSDRNEKYDISYIGMQSDYDTNMTDEQLIKLIMGFMPVVFKRINGESGRPHHGIIAQDFEGLLKEIGLSDHAAFIKSPKTKNIEVEKEVEKEVTKEDGTVEIVKETIKEVQQEEIPNEYIYGIRYEELISDVIRFCQLLKEENTKQHEEMEELSKRLTELESIVKGA